MLTPARTNHENFHNSISVEDRDIEDRRSRIEDRAPIFNSIFLFSTLDPRSSIFYPRSSTFDPRPLLDSSRRRKLWLWFALPSPLFAWRPHRLNRSYQAKVRRHVQSSSLKGR